MFSSKFWKCKGRKSPFYKAFLRVSDINWPLGNIFLPSLFKPMNATNGDGHFFE